MNLTLVEATKIKRLTVEIEDGRYIPRALCSVGRDGEIDDYDGCVDYCEDGCEGECGECGIRHCFDRLGAYENMHEKIIKRIDEIKATSYYPHNFTGQMVEDLEWVLSQLNWPLAQKGEEDERNRGDNKNHC